MNEKSLPSMKDLETEWPGVFVNNEVTMNYLVAKNVLIVLSSWYVGEKGS